VAPATGPLVYAVHVFGADGRDFCTRCGWSATTAWGAGSTSIAGSAGARTSSTRCR